MSYLLDWNFEILPSLYGSDPHTEVSLTAMQAFSTIGIHRFLLLAPYDPTRPIALHLHQRNAYASILKKELPKTLSLQVASRTTLREGLSGMSGLESLCHPKTGYLPLNLPFSVYEDWMDAELNRLLYRRHQKLLFLSFETALILYPQEFIEKLMRIESAAFQFGYASLDQPSVQNAIKRLLHMKKPVLFGTGQSHFDKAYILAFCEKLEAAKAAFSKESWAALLRANRQFWY